ncbi:MAG TPA: hypothetical protein VI895_06085, partial [Bdellovibrionota bacterium]|nr:hypothetical protein [Bdellovibrionota bacterium]
MLVRNIGVCLTALLALSLGVAGCSNQSDESVSSSSGFVDKSGGVSAPASDLSVFSAERRGGDGGGSSSSGGYGYYGKFPAATFQPFYPSDCVDNPATCFWKPAECAVAPTAVFTANQEVVSVTASGNGANGVKGKFTFRDEIGGIQPKYKINDVRGAGSNGAGPYTILASTTSSITHETTLTVAESTVAFSGSALGNIEYEFEQLIPDCSVNGIHPLYIYGCGFPYSDQTGVSLTIRLQERTMPAPIGYQPLCDLFVLGGANYRFVDQSNASFDVPTYDSDWNTWEGCPDGDTGSNGPVLCADGSRRCNCHGQVKPELYGCSGDIGDRRAGLTIGAADQEYSTVLSAFAFGSR